MVGARRQSHHADEALHLRGRHPLGGCSISQLTEMIGAPSPDGAVRLQCHSEVLASGDVRLGKSRVSSRTCVPIILCTGIKGVARVVCTRRLCVTSRRIAQTEVILLSLEVDT